MSNRLSSEISPYLLQHADNPVDWYPWSAEALERAREEDKPIFLSIGYSACHWCHVMAHESFQSGPIARLLNEHFIPIKVDREERPELDQLYMEAVQMMTGSGGWPLSVFLTPSLQPFFGGTYWPPQSRGGMPGFDQVLRAVADAWKNRRDQALEHAEKLTQLLRDVRLGGESAGPSAAEPGPELLRNADAVLARSFDPHCGGFGTAPKFPHPLDLRLLLRSWRRTGQGPLLSMVTTTLDRMAAGGIYDHLGGGFHRYSTDARWLVPHFEKMLYDNALLAVAYLEAWQATHNGQYAQVVRETLDYLLREMTAPEGGFYSTEDADSEGEEGKFYLWRPAEVAAVLGPQAAHAFCHVYDVSEPGNFEGRNILNRSKTPSQSAVILGRSVEELEAELASSRRRLLEARAARVRPGRDDKVLVSWNGLMIDALARSVRRLGPAAVCRRGRLRRSVPAFRFAESRGSFASRLARWPVPARCFFGRLCQPGQRPALALRGPIRGVLDRRGRRAGRRDPPPLPRSGRGRLFLHRRRPRVAHRAKRTCLTAPSPAAAAWPRWRWFAWESSAAATTTWRRPASRCGLVQR